MFEVLNLTITESVDTLYKHSVYIDKNTCIFNILIEYIYIKSCSMFQRHQHMRLVQVSGGVPYHATFWPMVILTLDTGLSDSGPVIPSCPQ